MRITHVLSAVNNNPKYTKFVPLFITQWKQCYPEITPVLVFIGTTLPAELEPYKEFLHLFPPIPSLNSATVAQVIRLLYPCLLPNDAVVLITDMDMLPGRSAYFQQCASMIPEGVFGSLRQKSIVAANQIAICYNVARADTWRAIFGIHKLEDIVSFLESTIQKPTDGIHGGTGWYTDQELLHTYVTAWEKKGGRVLFLNDSQTFFKRLDFFHHCYNKQTFLDMLCNNYYADCHLYAHECNWTLDDIQFITSAIQSHNTS